MGVCVNKPAGMTMYRSFRARSHPFVLTTLLKRQLSRKVYPVHRLDHRTSGAILFAFDSQTCANLHTSLTTKTTTTTTTTNNIASENKYNDNDDSSGGAAVK